MRRWYLTLLACLFVGMALAVDPPPILVVQLTDDASDAVRTTQAMPLAVTSKDPSAVLTPVFQPPADPAKRAIWREHHLHQWFSVQSNTQTAQNLAAELKTGGDIVRVELSSVGYAKNFPTDYTNFDMWGLTRMELPMAWDLGTGDASILVTTIDTGCRIGHPDLIGNIWINPGEDLNGDGIFDASDNNGVDDDGNGFVDDVCGWDFVSQSYTPYGPIEGEDYGPRDNAIFPDIHGHGTHVAGSLAASTDNDIGVPSASWNVKQMPLRAGFAVDNAGSMAGIGYDVDFAPAIQYAADMGSRIISISFGGTSFSTAYQDAINYANALGVTVFAAAGNEDHDVLTYPAAYDNVIAVGAIDRGDVRAWFSNYGYWVDVMAPGVDIWSTLSNNAFHPVDYQSKNGTSMACPNAAAVGALLLSADPTLSPFDLEALLTMSADNVDANNPGYEGMLGAGVVNAYTAMMMLTNPDLPGPMNLFAGLDAWTGTVHLMWDPPPPPPGALDELMGYNIYRDGWLVANVTDTEFWDTLPDYGTYQYWVTAQYDIGESGASNDQYVEWYDQGGGVEYFAPVPRTGLPYAIVITDAMFGDRPLMPGDEIGVFDGDLCVGAARYSEGYPVPLVAWEGDPEQALPGYTAGNPMQFRCWLANESVELVVQATFDQGDGSFGAGPYSVVNLGMFNPEPQHFAPVPRTGLPYALVVDNAQIEDGDLVPGDEVAVFDGELCVGAAIVSGQWPLGITAWEGDPAQELPGFTAGNTMTFRVWSQEQDLDLPAVPEYSVGDGTFGFGPFAQFSLNAFSSVTQTVSLAPNRFELVSMHVYPLDYTVGSVFSSVEDLVIVYQDNGHFYIPGVINTIGEVDATEAYRVFTSVEDTWELSGPPMNPATSYHLNANRWNWMGYPMDHTSQVETMMGGMVEHLVIIQNDDGFFYIPDVINTLVDLVPGDGYMVFVDETMDYVFPTGPELVSQGATPHVTASAVPDAPAPTGLPWNVLVSFTDDLKVSAATVELLDGSTVVGKAFVQADQPLTPVTAWQGDREYGLSGFVPGHELDVRVLDASGAVLPAKTNQSLTFGSGPYGMLNVEGAELPLEYSVGAGYPNPFNPSVTIPFALPDAGEVTISVVNVLGQQVYEATRNYNAGRHQFVFDHRSTGRDLVSGVYFVRVQYEARASVQKVVLMK